MHRMIIPQVGLTAIAVLILEGLFSPTPPASTSAKLCLLRDLSYPRIKVYSGGKLCDWNGDGGSDLAVLHDGRFVVLSARGEILHESLLPDVSLDILTDADGDGRSDLFVSWTDGEDLHIAVLDESMEEKKRFSAKGLIFRGAPDSRIESRYLVDLDSDGSPELIARVNSGYGQKPRGIYCFDFRSSKLIWKHLMGPSPSKMGFVDLDGDGKLDVVAGSYSPGNGSFEADGTDDMHCYIHALRHDGSLLWIRKLGGHFTGTAPIVADVDEDRKPDILVKVRSGPDYGTEVGKIVRLDHNGEITCQFDSGNDVKSFCLLPASADGKMAVLATDRHGRIYKLDTNLRVLQSAQLGETQHESTIAHFVACEDVTGDGSPEVILTYTEQQFISGRNPRSDRGPRNVRHYHNNSVLVLDADFRTLARFVVADKWENSPGLNAELIDADGDGTHEILVLADRALLLGVE